MATQKKNELTPKQERFVHEYLIDLNATQAAIRAGYSEKTAKHQASRLLLNVGIHARIEAAKRKRSERTEITQDYVLRGIQEVAERCLQRKPVMEWDRDNKCMVQAQDENGNDIWQFDANGANKAFENLGKHVGVFEKDNRQKEINVTIIDSYDIGGDGSGR